LAKARELKQMPRVRRLAFPTVRFHSVSLRVFVLAPQFPLKGCSLAIHCQWCPLFVEGVVVAIGDAGMAGEVVYISPLQSN